MPMYSQHDWSTLTWALMLTCMVTVVFAAMVVFLVVAGRAKAVPGQRRHRRAG
ncbi:hypothetical protein GCM10009623_09930 [Nocardioides aestuarii]|uniref:Uncharacterized protein n=1 Tax=Nocardioides aestuarii TaxID=252231 RepID=A0ABW4TJS3_9ACTN